MHLRPEQQGVGELERRNIITKANGTHRGWTAAGLVDFSGAATGDWPRVGPWTWWDSCTGPQPLAQAVSVEESASVATEG